MTNHSNVNDPPSLSFWMNHLQRMVSSERVQSLVWEIAKENLANGHNILHNLEPDLWERSSVESIMGKAVDVLEQVLIRSANEGQTEPRPESKLLEHVSSSSLFDNLDELDPSLSEALDIALSILHRVYQTHEHFPQLAHQVACLATHWEQRFTGITGYLTPYVKPISNSSASTPEDARSALTESKPKEEPLPFSSEDLDPMALFELHYMEAERPVPMRRPILPAWMLERMQAFIHTHPPLHHAFYPGFSAIGPQGQNWNNAFILDRLLRLPVDKLVEVLEHLVTLEKVDAREVLAKTTTQHLIQLMHEGLPETRFFKPPHDTAGNLTWKYEHLVKQVRGAFRETVRHEQRIGSYYHTLRFTRHPDARVREAVKTLLPTLSLSQARTVPPLSSLTMQGNDVFQGLHVVYNPKSEALFPALATVLPEHPAINPPLNTYYAEASAIEQATLQVIWRLPEIPKESSNSYSDWEYRHRPFTLSLPDTPEEPLSTLFPQVVRYPAAEWTARHLQQESVVLDPATSLLFWCHQLPHPMYQSSMVERLHPSLNVDTLMAARVTQLPSLHPDSCLRQLIQRPGQFGRLSPYPGQWMAWAQEQVMAKPERLRWSETVSDSPPLNLKDAEDFLNEVFQPVEVWLAQHTSPEIAEAWKALEQHAFQHMITELSDHPFGSLRLTPDTKVASLPRPNDDAWVLEVGQLLAKATSVNLDRRDRGEEVTTPWHLWLFAIQRLGHWSQHLSHPTRSESEQRMAAMNQLLWFLKPHTPSEKSERMMASYRDDVEAFMKMGETLTSNVSLGHFDTPTPHETPYDRLAPLWVWTRDFPYLVHDTAKSSVKDVQLLTEIQRRNVQQQRNLWLNHLPMIKSTSNTDAPLGVDVAIKYGDLAEHDTLLSLVVGYRDQKQRAQEERTRSRVNIDTFQGRPLFEAFEHTDALIGAFEKLCQTLKISSKPRWNSTLGTSPVSESTMRALALHPQAGNGLQESLAELVKYVSQSKRTPQPLDESLQTFMQELLNHVESELMQRSWAQSNPTNPPLKRARF